MKGLISFGHMMGPASGAEGSSPPVTPVTWNPLDKTANVTLSGGNLVAVLTGVAAALVRGTRGVAGSEKVYCEYLVNVNGGQAYQMGVANLAAAAPPGDDANGWVCRCTPPGTGAKGNAGAYTASGFSTTILVGSVIGVAVNRGTNSVWFAVNNVWQGAGSPNPATGTAANFTNLTGTIYPVFGAANGFSNSVIARFKSSDFTYTPPSGFLPWESP